MLKNLLNPESLPTKKEAVSYVLDHLAKCEMKNLKVTNIYRVNFCGEKTIFGDLMGVEFSHESEDGKTLKNIFSVWYEVNDKKEKFLYGEW